MLPPISIVIGTIHEFEYLHIGIFFYKIQKKTIGMEGEKWRRYMRLRVH